MLPLSQGGYRETQLRALNATGVPAINKPTKLRQERLFKKEGLRVDTGAPKVLQPRSESFKRNGSWKMGQYRKDCAG
jgi:hypothetical protein